MGSSAHARTVSDVFREWNKRLTEDQAKKTFEKCQKLETEFGEYLTGMLSPSVARVDAILDIVYGSVVPSRTVWFATKCLC